ncbi:Protein of unknown function [Gryllus bimaculatus]|nr:Protein of unknown function [Gryllus bimaculatus]
MDQSLNVFAVAAWVLLLLYSGPVSSDESCAKSATKTAEPAACSRITSSTLATAAKSATTSVTPVHDRSVHSASEAALMSQMHGSWRVVAGYVRKFTTKAFCPEVTFSVDSVDPNNVTVSWNKAEPFENVVPRGRMTRRDNWNLVDDDGFHHMEVIKLERFLALRVWNLHFRRALILSPVSVPGKKDVGGNVFDFIMSIHADVHLRDGPAWYICAAAYYSMPSSGDGR